MKDGDEISFEVMIQVDRKLSQVGVNTRVDQTYWLGLKFPDGKYARKDIGTGMFIVAGVFSHESELENCKIIKQPTGMNYKQAIIEAQVQLQKLPRGIHPSKAFKGWAVVDPHDPRKPKSIEEN